MTDPDKIVRDFCELLAQVDSPENYGPWRVVTAERWEEAAGQGWATAYIEVIAPAAGMEFDPGAVIHIAAEPDRIEHPVFDDGGAADRAYAAEIDRQVLG